MGVDRIRWEFELIANDLLSIFVMLLVFIRAISKAIVDHVAILEEFWDEEELRNEFSIRSTC